jgi:hypothetical protein
MSADADRSSWPPHAIVTDGLRRVGRHDIADALRDAVQGGATGTEVLGRIGLVLRAHDRQRALLTLDEKRAWDEMMRTVNRLHPPRVLTYWILRLFRP